MKKKMSTTAVAVLATLVITCSPIKASAAMNIVEAPATGVSSIAKFDVVEEQSKTVKPLLLKNIKKLVNKVKK
ncbi:hypothetical protein P9B03_00215 [Metasolibacillus meyeri]|uniref:Uncharacterized protein n=1 Tax=Metasolibacillus meyeri TaxID=1071052 RepID=A0AAW9NQH2_9BACL|nr:hypothetical protein [Metasolibacillus meyeri]MEC1176911.1 hypothetical protein [Metasolibacillus meyeri]